MNWSLDWAGGALGLFAAALAAAAFAWHARRSRGGRLLLALRALAALVLALAALRPTVAVREVKRVKPRLLVLLDAGHAMQGRSAKTTRLEAAVAFLTRRRPEIEAGAEVSFYALDDHGRRLAGWEGLKDLKSSEAGFHPAEALRDVADAAQEPAERAWLLTDGNAETDRDLERSLAALRMPVDVIGVGPARRGRGVSFSELKTPDFAFLHGRFAIEASVEASGAAGETLDLTLLREQKGAGLEPVGRQSLRIRSDFETASASFTASAQTLGAERYRLEVRGLSGALLHSRDFRVEVIRQKYRIMYLAGRPSAEYANLREFLKSDPNHELVSFVILRNPDNPSFVADQELSLIPFPAEEIFVQSLNQFDLFILENFSYARFNLPPSYLASLRSFVSGGGALLVIGGENAFSVGGYRGTPLEEMLPVVLSGQVPDFIPGLFRAKPVAAAHPLLRLYDTAEASAAAWEALPPLDGFAQFLSVREGATVLATHATQRTLSGAPLPVLALRDYGRGKVLLVSSDSTWRWRLGAADDFKTAAFYARFWTRAVQYLTGSLDLSKVKFAPLPDRLVSREPARFSLRVFDESFRPAASALTQVSVLWTPPGGRAVEVASRETEPGVYAVELTGLKIGAHVLQASARYRGKPWGLDQVRFAWEALPVDAPMDRRWLKRAADASGGTVRDLAEADVKELLERLSPVKSSSEVKQRFHPWASPWWLGVLGGLLLLEWALRRLRGYP